MSTDARGCSSRTALLPASSTNLHARGSNATGRVPAEPSRVERKRDTRGDLGAIHSRSSMTSCSNSASTLAPSRCRARFVHGFPAIRRSSPHIGARALAPALSSKEGRAELERARPRDERRAHSASELDVRRFPRALSCSLRRTSSWRVRSSTLVRLARARRVNVELARLPKLDARAPRSCSEGERRAGAPEARRSCASLVLGGWTSGWRARSSTLVRVARARRVNVELVWGSGARAFDRSRSSSWFVLSCANVELARSRSVQLHVERQSSIGPVARPLMNCWTIPFDVFLKSSRVP